MDVTKLFLQAARDGTHDRIGIANETTSKGASESWQLLGGGIRFMQNYGKKASSVKNV